ncbi:hypothetical protein BUALT_Bualt10G0087600 [Buddleja alternifolia]|uniref:SWIM-type domain-containing protein n=1 Tax=Buddleja alternifolia TaxID=168488 RepID=A0AAV6X4F3_9LAMI|nr:hypothetical protein BUALT_Bualt10G0087600 [Buddleja alternifolia]
MAFSSATNRRWLSQSEKLQRGNYTIVAPTQTCNFFRWCKPQHVTWSPIGTPVVFSPICGGDSVGENQNFGSEEDGEELLVAVARDGNDNMLPISMALVLVENTDAWSWFLTELFEDIGHVQGRVIISDRHKGLVEAVKTKAPYSEHRKIEAHDPKIREDVETTYEWLNREQLSTGEGYEYDVDQSLDKYIVDLEKKTCTCGMFQLCGYLCSHAHPVIAYKRDDVEKYVDLCYNKDTYLKIYPHMIHGVPKRRHYIKTSFQPLLPPKLKVKRGVVSQNIDAPPFSQRDANSSQPAATSQTNIKRKASSPSSHVGHAQIRTKVVVPSAPGLSALLVLFKQNKGCSLKAYTNERNCMFVWGNNSIIPPLKLSTPTQPPGYGPSLYMDIEVY